MEAVENTQFLPQSCFEGSIEDSYDAMEKEEAYFRTLFEIARRENLWLKDIASFENGKASFGLQSINANHNFANLSGKDNAVLFYTNRYSEQPLLRSKKLALTSWRRVFLPILFARGESLIKIRSIKTKYFLWFKFLQILTSLLSLPLFFKVFAHASEFVRVGS